MRLATTPKARLTDEPETLWWYRLSLALGIPVRQLMSSITPRELQTYKAVALIDGPWWGTDAQAVYAADICYTLACCHTSEPGKWKDYLRVWDHKPQPKAKLSWTETAAFLDKMVARQTT